MFVGIIPPRLRRQENKAHREPSPSRLLALGYTSADSVIREKENSTLGSETLNYPDIPEVTTKVLRRDMNRTG